MKNEPGTSQLLEEIAEAFPGSSASFSDAFIEANQELSSLEGEPTFNAAIPAYMAWCVRNAHTPEVLVHDYTVRALCELGRSKNPEIKHLSFKFHCSPKQTAVVISFLRWSLNPELLHHTEHIERALKQWATAPKS